jgi:hypothetical protein
MRQQRAHFRNLRLFSWVDYIALFLFFYLFVLQLYSIWPFTIDDMYISLRYARHWAAGDGLLWNLSEPPVEGYSNFSFVVVGALSILLHLNPVNVLKSLGVIGLLFTIIAVYVLGRFMFDRRMSYVPCLTVLLFQGQVIWAASGLETTVFQALICGALVCLLRGMGYVSHPGECRHSDSKFLIASGLLLSLAGMTRPEAPVWMLLFFGLLVWDIGSFKKEGGSRKHVVYFCATIIITFVPYFLWRWHYYGRLFPNSVYCKGLLTTHSNELNWNYIQLIWPFVLLALPACVRARQKWYLFLGLPSIAYLLLLIHADPIVAFDNRLFLPCFILLLPLSFQGLNILLLHVFQQKDTYFYTAVLLVWGLVNLLFLPKMTLSEYRFFSKNPIQGEQLRAEVLAWLHQHAQEGDRVVLADCGMIPYWSDLDYIDSYCLNNAAMTQYSSKHRYQYFCERIMQQQPKMILLTSLTEQGKARYTPSDACFNVLLKQHPEYKLVKVFATKDNESVYRYQLFATL